MAQLTITIVTEWRDTEPDGSACYLCGDQCLLSMHGLFTSTGKWATPDPFLVVCQSCFGAIKEGSDG